MRAMVLEAYGELAVREVDAPVAGAGELLVEVAACGICGSDVHGYDGSSGRRIPPVVMGHEAAGVVAAVGAGVSGFAVGDRVTFDSTVWCGECAFCRGGAVNLCDRREVLGVSCGEYRRAGAFAERLVVPARIAYTLPDGLGFAEAAMLEAVSVALHGVHAAEMKPGATVLVVGAGMIGLLLLQAARAHGAGRVLVTDVDASRLEMAQAMGADAVLRGSGAGVLEAVLHETAARGVDVVLEAVGRDETVALSVDAVRRGGTVVLVGNITPRVTLPLQKVVSRQVRLQGSCASAGEYPEAMAMMVDGRIRVGPLMSAVAPLEEGAAWFARLHAREAGLMKVVLDPRLHGSAEGVSA